MERREFLKAQRYVVGALTILMRLNFSDDASGYPITSGILALASDRNPPLNLGPLLRQDPVHLINWEDEWKYLYQNLSPDKEWKKLTFDDADWESGKAELGYGDGDEETVIGPVVLEDDHDTGTRPVTVYFRKVFQLPDEARGDFLFLRLKADDGAVVHLNGEKVVHFNMPGGVGHNDRAVNVVTGPTEERWTWHWLPPDLLNAGDNLLAVEVHQHRDPAHGDLSFNAHLMTNSERWTLIREDSKWAEIAPIFEPLKDELPDSLVKMQETIQARLTTQ